MTVRGRRSLPGRLPEDPAPRQAGPYGRPWGSPHYGKPLTQAQMDREADERAIRARDRAAGQVDPRYDYEGRGEPKVRDLGSQAGLYQSIPAEGDYDKGEILPEPSGDPSPVQLGPPGGGKQGEPAELTPQQHLAYQLFLLDNPGDSARATAALGFDTRAAQAQAPDGPGALVRQYYADTQNPEAMTQADGTRTGRDPADLASALIIDRDRGSWEQRLREEAAAAGASYDPSDLEGIIRNFSYADNAGVDPQTFIDDAIDTYRMRGQSGGDRDKGGYNTAWADDDPRRNTFATDAPPPGYTGTSWTPPPPAPPPGAGAPPGAPQGAYPGGGAAPWSQGQGRGPNTVQSIVGPWMGAPPRTPVMGSSVWAPYDAAAPYVPPTPYEAGVYQAPTYAPAAPFSGPTAEQMAADPGYQFRLTEGQKALERSGAARGVTNTGGTLKNILDYGQQAASQEYGNVYNRAANAWGMNEGARQQAFDRNAQQGWQGWGANEAGRLNAYQMTEADRAGAYGMNEANRAAAAQFNQGGYQQAYQNEAQRKQQQYANQYNQWGDQFNQWRQQGADRFNEQWMLANA